jgi:hypothetical protein
VTHDPNVSRLTHAFSFQPDESAGIPAFVTLDLPFPRPEVLDEVPWQLLKFRADHEQQRLEFREKVAEIAGRIPKEGDPDAIKDAITAEKQRFSIALREHEKAMDRLVAGTATSSLQIGISTLLPKLLSATALPASSVVALTTTAVAMIGIGWWAKYSGERAKLLASPYQYLLSVERFAQPGMTRKLGRGKTQAPRGR